MQTYIPIILIAIFVFLLVGVIGSLQLMINRALKKFIIPDIISKAYIYRGYKSVGFFSIGDFTRISDADRPYFPFLFKNGSPLNSFFFYIYYRTSTEDKRVTVRIDTLFLFVRKVKYSGEL